MHFVAELVIVVAAVVVEEATVAVSVTFAATLISFVLAVLVIDYWYSYFQQPRYSLLMCLY